MWKELCILAALGLWAWQDCKRMRVNIYTVFAAVAVAACYSVFSGGDMAGGFCGAMVGVFLLIAAAVSRQSVGVADGLVFVFTGILLGFWGNIVLLFASLSLGALFSVYQIVVKRRSRHYEFAFLPFVLGGYIAVLAMGGI